MNSRLSAVILAASLALGGATGATAQTPLRGHAATLAAPLPTPRAEPINGVLWRCTGDSCTGAANGSRPLASCARVARTFGPVVRFTTKAGDLSVEDLARCNAQA